MSVNNVPTNQSTASTYNAPVSGGGLLSDAAMQTMSPEDIMNYVRQSLGSIDGQMNDYKNMVAERQKKADELREAMSLLSDMKQSDGWIRNANPENYNRLMTILAKNSGDPSIKSVYDKLSESYGNFTATEDFTDVNGNLVKAGEPQGQAVNPEPPFLLDANGNPQVDANNMQIPNPKYNPHWHDAMLDVNETQMAIDNTKRGLEGLNSDNELVMMDLQKLMQQRNQITQFASNTMSLDNETKKAVIGNIR